MMNEFNIENANSEWWQIYETENGLFVMRWRENKTFKNVLEGIGVAWELARKSKAEILLLATVKGITVFESKDKQMIRKSKIMKGSIVVLT